MRTVSEKLENSGRYIKDMGDFAGRSVRYRC